MALSALAFDTYYLLPCSVSFIRHRLRCVDGFVFHCFTSPDTVSHAASPIIRHKKDSLSTVFSLAKSDYTSRCFFSFNPCKKHINLIIETIIAAIMPYNINIISVNTGRSPCAASALASSGSKGAPLPE